MWINHKQRWYVQRWRLHVAEISSSHFLVKGPEDHVDDILLWAFFRQSTLAYSYWSKRTTININYFLRIIQLVSGRTSTQIAMQLNCCQKQCNAITAKFMMTQMRLIAGFSVIKLKHNTTRLLLLVAHAEISHHDAFIQFNTRLYTNKREIFQLKLCHVPSELGRISGDWKSLWGFSVSSVLSNK